MTVFGKPRLVGFNHVALEVADIEEALAFYGRLFTFELRAKSDTMSRGVVPMSSLWSGGLNAITALRLRWLRSASDAMGASVVIHHHST